MYGIYELIMSNLLVTVVFFSFAEISFFLESPSASLKEL